MSDGYFYPPINEHHIIQISKLYELNPDYFSNKDCPYPKEVIEVFTGTAKYHDFDSHAPESTETDSILSQIQQLSKQLKEYGRGILDDEGNSSTDRNTYFRLSVALMEKLVDIREKITNIKEYEMFISEVLDIMDSELDADQRSRVLERLERFKNTSEKGADVVRKKETKGAINEESSEEPDSFSDL